jgi:alkylation response protein AidB-like acyl-CoA dehydrogenase
VNALGLQDRACVSLDGTSHPPADFEADNYSIFEGTSEIQRLIISRALASASDLR